MIDSSLRHEIKGLDELFKYIPEDYSFHDSELESVNWDMMQNKLTVVYSCHYGLNGHVYYVKFHIIPEMTDFTVYISPHISYTGGIEINKSDNEWSKYTFVAQGAGPEVNCKDLWVEIVETDPEKFFED